MTPNKVILFTNFEEAGERSVRFRLTYEGPLITSANVAEKHRIRKVFHRQLRRLWYSHPTLVPRTQHWMPPLFLSSAPQKTYPNVIEHLADNWTENGFRYVPLVSKGDGPLTGLTCQLEILMLRPLLPGGLLTNSDIDNRLKTLFDSLRKPSGKQETGAAMPDSDEDPFFVLLEDDRLITHLSVETDMLLQPVSTDPKSQGNDVRLVIGCTVQPIEVGPHNVDFMGM